MQKRKSYLSLLLASFLLLFTYSFATAQTGEISFEGGIDGKDVPRCVTADQSVYVTSDVALGAFEVIFEVDGDFTGFSFTPAQAIIDHPMSTSLAIDGNVVRFAGFLGDNELDACLDAGTTTIGTLHFETADIPNPCEGVITVVPATVDDPFTHGSLFVVNCCDDPAELTPDFINGKLNIINQAPEITWCPDPITVHFGTTIEFDVACMDYDTPACEELTFSLEEGSPEDADIDAAGHVTWVTTGPDVCDHTLFIRVTDKCGAYDECEVEVCVWNTPPEFTDVEESGWMDNTIYTVWGVTLIQETEASDFGPTLGPSALHYSIVDLMIAGTTDPGPTTYGLGLGVDPVTGVWTWDIGYELAYSGEFILRIAVDDGLEVEVCDPCSPENSDTVSINISVTGYFTGIDVINSSEGSSSGVIQGSNVTVPIRLRDDPSWKGPYDYQIGGFDFLIAYDASALTLLKVRPSILTDEIPADGRFEYFTYRHVDNCGGACPTGMVRIVGLRETNDGFLNDTHVWMPGELALLDFYVSTDLTLECQFVPIRFFWIDCGDNTISDETGEILYVAKDIYDHDGTLLTDPLQFGIHGPLNLPVGECYITTIATNAKAQPLMAILFQNGGIKITCIDEIDDRGDVNLNGIAYEVADAVVFTNYFIKGMSAFTFVPNVGQVAATDVNADGTPLSVADLVYLIRIIVGDALPINYPKLTPSAPIDVAFNGSIVDLRGTTDVGAALFVFDREIIPTLTDNANYMDIKYGHINGGTHVLVYDMKHRSLSAGNVLSIEGEANLVGVEAADYFGAPLEVEKTIIVPTEFALLQNYPNPFNPETVIGLALPVASDWNMAIYNVSGQLVKEFSGYSEAGTIQITWDATNVASGIYFYKATTDQFSATKKMVLLK